MDWRFVRASIRVRTRTTSPSSAQTYCDWENLAYVEGVEGGIGPGYSAKLILVARFRPPPRPRRTREPAAPGGAQPVNGSSRWEKSQVFCTMPEQELLSLVPGQPPLSRSIAQIDRKFMPLACAKLDVHVQPRHGSLPS